MLVDTRRATFALLLLLISGCDSTTDTLSQTLPPAAERHESTRATVSNTDKPVAHVDGLPIMLSHIDERLALPLFDLEWRRYELRKAELKNIVGEQLDSQKAGHAGNVELLLSPPTPPRVSFPLDDRPLKGAPDAAIALQVFCSYQSPHCARLQPVIKELEAQYGAKLNIRYYDYPQSFHRFGVSSANAARCADEQDKSWAFRTSLFGAIDQLGGERYRLIAQQLGLDEKRFASCLETQRYKHEVGQDVALAQSLGFGNVPVVLINGLYVKGPQPLGVYQYYIDGELTRESKGYMAEREQNNMMLSRLPIRLLATSLSNQEGESTAIVEFAKTDDIRTYKAGEYMQDQVALLEIEKDRIIIDNQGRKEFIRLQALAQREAVGSDPSDSVVALPVAEKESVSNESSSNQKRELPAKGEIVLSKSWVEEQLENQTELEAYFKNAEHVVEGVHLMRLENVENEPFYKTLGLQSGDVIMKVGEEWVHEGQNPLWETLGNDESITLVLMRNGLPVRYDYRVE